MNCQNAVLPEDITEEFEIKINNNQLSNVINMNCQNAVLPENITAKFEIKINNYQF